jgi:hypothetical protein
VSGWEWYSAESESDPQQLGKGRNVPGFFRDAVACADNLSNVMNGAAKKETDTGMIKIKERNDHRVDDHRHGAEGRHSDHREHRIALMGVSPGQHGRNGERSRGAADGDGSSGQQPERAGKPHHPCRSDAEHNREEHSPNHGEHWADAETEDLRNSYLRSQEAHRYAQDPLGRELNTGDALPLLRQKIERHAEQQRK